MKPSYGRVSRYGLVAFASSLDQIGPFGKDVTDCALLLNVIAGYDARDSTSMDLAVPDFTQTLQAGIRGLRVGVPSEYLVQGVDPGVVSAVRGALDVFRALGADVDEVSLPHTEHALPVYYLIAPPRLRRTWHGTTVSSTAIARQRRRTYGKLTGNRDNTVLAPR